MKRSGLKKHVDESLRKVADVMMIFKRSDSEVQNLFAGNVNIIQAAEQRDAYIPFVPRPGACIMHARVAAP